MKCDTNRELFLQELYGELPEARTRELADHRTSCPDCAAFFTELKTTMELCDRVSDPEPSDASLEAIRSFAAEELAAPVKKETREFAFPAFLLKRVVPLAAAAAVVVMLGTGLFNNGTQNGTDLYAWDAGLEDELLAVQDEVDVLEWEIREGGEYASLDEQIDDLQSDIDDNHDLFGTF